MPNVYLVKSIFIQSGKLKWGKRYRFNHIKCDFNALKVPFLKNMINPGIILWFVPDEKHSYIFMWLYMADLILFGLLHIFFVIFRTEDPKFQPGTKWKRKWFIDNQGMGQVTTSIRIGTAEGRNQVSVF